MLLSPSSPFFRISTAGLAGICHIELPHDGELVDNFQCTSTAISSYKLSHIKPAMKALTCANKVSLRTDTCGLLCFQYMVKTEDGHTCYIEYYVRITLFQIFTKKHNIKRYINTRTKLFQISPVIDSDE